VPETRNWRNVSVVGVSHYQEALWAAAGVADTGEPVGVETTAELVPEPENPHDPRAVKVLIGGEHVGYLSRRDARRYRRQIRAKREAGDEALVDAFIGGLGRRSENPNLGVSLKLPTDEDGRATIEPGGAEIARRVLAERERGTG
jgi:HIRAN domain-containing protein